MTLQQLSGRLARWTMELQQNDFDIQYQKETLNRVAEALSRQPVSSSTNREPERAVVGDRDVEGAGPKDGAVRPLVEGVLIEPGKDIPTRRKLRSRSNGMKGYSKACKIGLENTLNTVCEGEAVPEHREIARRSYKEEVGTWCPSIYGRTCSTKRSMRLRTAIWALRRR